MNKPLISIIIATYNRPNLIGRALKSIEAQTFKDFEVIVVDDGSTPPLQLKMNDYKMKIRLFRLEQNSGFHTKPKNYGISKAKGKYIAYLDDDDEYKPDHLQVLLEAIQAGNYDFVYGLREYFANGKVVETSTLRPWDPQGAGKAFWLGVPDLLHTKKIIYALGGWNEEIKRFADFELGWRLGRYGTKGLGVGKVITRCHRHNKQMSYDSNRQAIDPQTYIKYPIVQRWLKSPSAKNLVGIYTFSWNRLEYTQRCIKALEKKAGWPYVHLVIDQGSTDGSAEWLKKNYGKNNNSEVIILSENIGLPAGINLAHELLIDAGIEWIMKLDNDGELLSNDCLKKLMAAMLDPEKPRDLILSPYVKGLVVHKGGVSRGLPPKYPQRWEKYNISFTSGLGGICRLCHKSVLARYGQWDTNKPKHYAEDLEFTGKWEELGWFNGYMEDIFVLHMDGSLGQQKKYPEYFKHKDHAGFIDPSQFKNYVPDF